MLVPESVKVMRRAYPGLPSLNDSRSGKKNVVEMTSVLTLGEGAAGAVMVGSPGATGRWAAGPGATPPSWVVRVLGTRMAIQALTVLRVARRGAGERRRAVRAGAAVDGLHGASMILAAAAFPRYRRSALVSAAVAFTAAAVGGVASR